MQGYAEILHHQPIQVTGIVIESFSAFRIGDTVVIVVPDIVDEGIDQGIIAPLQIRVTRYIKQDAFQNRRTFPLIQRPALFHFIHHFHQCVFNQADIGQIQRMVQSRCIGKRYMRKRPFRYKSVGRTGILNVGDMTVILCIIKIVHNSGQFG